MKKAILVLLIMGWFGFYGNVHAEQYAGALCWNFSETGGNSGVSDLSLKLEERGENHYLCNGWLVMDGQEYNLFGKGEVKHQEFVISLNSLVQKGDGIQKLCITLNTDCESLGGTYRIVNIKTTNPEEMTTIATGEAKVIDCADVEGSDPLNKVDFSPSDSVNSYKENGDSLPYLDIKANGSDGPISVLPNSPVTFSISLDPGSYTGVNADWWFLGSAPDNTVNYLSPITCKMKPGILPTYMGPLFGFGSTPLLTIWDLAIGAHMFFFVVDFTMNDGGLTDPIYGDWVEIYVDPYEPNNTMETAWYSGSNSEGKWLSDIAGLGVQQDDDWYRIEVSPSGYERVKIDCRFTDADGGIDIGLYDASGTLLKKSTSTSDNELIDFVVPQAGTYYIKVYYSNEGNTYDLWWDDLKPSTSDTTSPDTTISSGPSGTVTSKNATFVYSGSDNITSSSKLVYSYILEGYTSSWSSYTSSTSKSFSNLENGSYTFKVKAKDEAGNIDASPATRTFTVNVGSGSNPFIGEWTGKATWFSENYTEGGWIELSITFNSSGKWSATEKIEYRRQYSTCAGTWSSSGSYSVDGDTVRGDNDNGYFSFEIDGNALTGHWDSNCSKGWWILLTKE